jgi:F0F1-type ATP synthase alpha subunit
VAHRPPVVFVYSDTAAGDCQAEGLVRITGDMATVQVSPSQTDVKLNFSEASVSPDVDDGFKLMKRAIFAPIAKISDIALINNPMLTGVTMIDALSPVGQGQNMLFIGHDLEDMRKYTMDFLKTQVRDGKRTKCVYASTTQDRSTVRRLLKASGLGNDIHVVAPEDSGVLTDMSSKAARAVAISWAACSVGEMYALEEGLNALVVVDTIDLHKQLWDLTTRVLVDVYGVNSVVKGDREGSASSEMRAFYSSLIQRSSQYKPSRGGGSVTLLLLTEIPRTTVDDDQVFDPSAFDEAPEKVKDRIKLLAQRNIPLTAETLRKVDIPIPTEGVRRLVLQHVDDLMSMSDGQIWFDEKREAAGQVPPVDPQRSVTRIGIGADTASRADAPALRRIAERLRLELSQASSMEGADDTDATKRQIQRRDALLLAMYQPSGSGGRRLSESCVALLAAQEGHLDEVVRSGSVSGTKEGEAVVQGLLDHVLRNAAAAMADIDSSLDLSAEGREELTQAIRSYFHS